MKFKRIGFSGAHGQGKSTLIRDLLDNCQLDNFLEKNKSKSVLYNSPSRDIAKTAGSHLVNEAGSGVTQVKIMHTHYINAACADTSSMHLYDRTAIDGLVYSMCLSDNISAEQLEIITKYFHITNAMYDIVFYVEPEIALVQDGVRSINVDFFNRVKDMFETILKKYMNTIPPLVRLKGTRAERLDTVCNYIFNS
jgi:nicotinamide riboside kinase